MFRSICSRLSKWKAHCGLMSYSMPTELTSQRSPFGVAVPRAGDDEGDDEWFCAAAQDKPFGGYPNADMEYCAKLSDLYIRYIGRSEAGPRTPVTPDVVGGVALAQCKHESTVTQAIPVLERKLLDSRFTLPPRGQAN